MAHTFTTIFPSVEKLLEAEYFIFRLMRADFRNYHYELNAFLSASRNVTFVLQASMARVPGFSNWYQGQQERMRGDTAMTFFVDLRNISQKQGAISIVGGSNLDGTWTYRFVGRGKPVPEELLGRDIVDCCASHISKLAGILIECVEAFPFDACPRTAFSKEGMLALGYDWADVAAALALPSAYVEGALTADVPDHEVLRILGRELEPIDVATIKRIRDGELKWDDTTFPMAGMGNNDLVDALASRLRAKTGKGTHPRDAFVGEIVARIVNQEKP